ncbi:hypothetical protein LX32DRAFT_13614 [Colletotrichum zoysiae]|uniref:Uncharacterized protein n=1 Tax=Colletotrichum zoysiae TaxID=1216348 RepID=A0AAD9HDB8_9PEZI|nr:hypothetical protein LX32DRAFT_13614 [Colletotrichum zoysiae]
MGSACSSHARCGVFLEDPTDADVIGIGVLLAFVLPVLASHVIVCLAYIARNTFHADQYMKIDNRILERLDGQQSPSSIRSMEYRQVILGLSDQLLITTFGILIAVYVQTCNMSLLCFQVGAELAFLVLGVHMNCLVALGCYFEDHRRQASLRMWLMAILLVFVLATSFLGYRTYYNDVWQTVACAIRFFKTKWPFFFVAWLAVCWWVTTGFSKSMYQLRDARSDFPRVYSLVHWALSVVYRNKTSKKSLDEWKEYKTENIHAKYRERCRLLQQEPKPPWWVTAAIVSRAIVEDFRQSLIFIMFWNLSYTVTGLYDLVDILVHAQIDYTPLLELKFGQTLPLVMLIVLVFSIMEASGSSEAGNDSSSRTNTETETGSSSLKQHLGGTESDKDLKTKFDLVEIVYRDTPRWVIKLAFFVGLAMTAGFFCLLVICFEETIIALCALNLLYQIGHICEGFWSFWRFRKGCCASGYACRDFHVSGELGWTLDRDLELSCSTRIG